MRPIATVLILMMLAGAARASIITAARKVRTGGTATVTTTTSGQRQIRLTIDPDFTVGFRLDILYPSELVSLDGSPPPGINASLAPSSIQYVSPFVNPNPGVNASILPTIRGGGGGIVSNVEGVAATVPGAPSAAPAPEDDGATDLFTLIFIDNNPYETKRFTILGTDGRGIDPSFIPFVADNYVDIRITDPNDPQFGQIVRIPGEDIEAATIIVEALDQPTGPRDVPLPMALWPGLAAGAFALRRRLTTRRSKLTTSP